MVNDPNCRFPRVFHQEIKRMAADAGVSQAEVLRILGRKFKEKQMRVKVEGLLEWE